MIRNVYSVYDIKAELYGVPFFMHTNGEAVRAFKRLVSDPQSLPSTAPGDFQLMHLGTFNDSTGQFSGNERPVNLGFGTDYVEKAPKPIPLTKEK